MPQHELVVHTPTGDRLAATLQVPEKTTGPAPAVLLCQGLSGRRDLVLPDVAAALAAAGFVSLRFDYAGCGDSSGDRGWIRPLDRVAQAGCCFAVLLATDGVDQHRVGVYGHSYGGATALGLAANEVRARAVVAVSGPGCGEDLLRAARPAWEWVEFRTRVRDEVAAIAAGAPPTVVPVSDILPFSPAFERAYAALKASQGGTSAMSGTGPALGTTEYYLASVPEMLRSVPQADAARLGHAPLLLINGAEDDTVPTAIVAPVYAAAPGPKRWLVVPGADHNTLDHAEGLDPVLPQVVAWFGEHLAPVA